MANVWWSNYCHADTACPRAILQPPCWRQSFLPSSSTLPSYSRSYPRCRVGRGSCGPSWSRPRRISPSRTPVTPGDSKHSPRSRSTPLIPPGPRLGRLTWYKLELEQDRSSPSPNTSLRLLSAAHDRIEARLVESGRLVGSDGAGFKEPANRRKGHAINLILPLNEWRTERAAVYVGVLTHQTIPVGPRFSRNRSFGPKATPPTGSPSSTLEGPWSFCWFRPLCSSTFATRRHGTMRFSPSG